MSEAVQTHWDAVVSLVLRREAARVCGRVLALGQAPAYRRMFPDVEWVVPETPEDALSSAMPDASFRTVLAIDTLTLAPDPAAAVLAMARVLEPGGTSFALVSGAPPEAADPALWRFTLRGLHRLFVDAGLQPQVVQGVNPPEGGVLRAELETFARQTPRETFLPDELIGWVDLMDDQRPLLQCCVAVKPAG